MASNLRLESLEDNIQDLKMGLAGSYNMTQSVNNKLDKNFQYVNLVLNPIIKKLNDQNKDIDLKAIENNYNNLAQENLSLKNQLNDVNNKLDNVALKITSLETSKPTSIVPAKAESPPKIDVKMNDFVKKIENAENERAKAEDIRAEAENKRKDVEEKRRQEELFRVVAEEERVKNENKREEKENERAKAEEDRISKYQEIERDYEENWALSENDRKQEEIFRVQAEDLRVDQENNRNKDYYFILNSLKDLLNEEGEEGEEEEDEEEEEERVKNENKREEKENERAKAEEEEEEGMGIKKSGKKKSVKKPFTRTYYYRSLSTGIHVFAVIDDITRLAKGRFIDRIRKSDKSTSNENLKYILYNLKTIVNKMHSKDFKNPNIKDVKDSNIEFQIFLRKYRKILSIPVLEIRRIINLTAKSLNYRLPEKKVGDLISIIDFYYAFVIESGHEGPNNEYKNSIRKFFNGPSNEIKRFLEGVKGNEDIFLQPGNKGREYLGQKGGDLKSIYEIIYRN